MLDINEKIYSITKKLDGTYLMGGKKIIFSKYISINMAFLKYYLKLILVMELNKMIVNMIIFIHIVVQVITV